MTCACCEGGIAVSRINDGVAECRRAARDEPRKGATQISSSPSGGSLRQTIRSGTCKYSEAEVRTIIEEAEDHHKDGVFYKR